MKFPRILTEMEVARMFKAAGASPAGQRDEMLLKCLYYLGLKSNEARGLKVADIDINENVITIRGRNERAIMIPGKFPFELMQFTAGRQAEELVFSGRGPEGTMSGRHIRRIVKDCARLAEVRNCEEIKPHTFRISYAAHLRKDGIPVKSIQQLLGHARRETTYIYTHGLQKMENKEQEAAEEAQTD